MTGVVIGSLAVALALAGTETSGRGTIPLAAQAVYDRALGVGLLLSAAAFGAAAYRAPWRSSASSGPPCCW